MEIKHIVLTIIFISTVFADPINHGMGKQHSSEEELEDGVDTLQNVMHGRMMEQRQYMDGKFAELSDSVHVSLEHITEVVESIERRQKYFQFCTQGICGQNGTCGLSEAEDTYQCYCDEGFVGENCEITGACNVALYEAQQKEPMPGREYPHCEEDGTYAGMQYIGSQAHCVTSENKDLGYYVNRWETGDDMHCQCARDEYFSEEEKDFNCLPNGNYPQYACDERWCWCQSSHGEQYGGLYNLGELDIEMHC